MRGPGAGLTRGRHSLLAPLRERSGQMAVELALLVPVIVAVALAVVNLMSFSELCARFDRVAPDAVLAHGASPSGSPEGLAGVEEVAEAIRRGMGTDACEIEVRVVDASESGSGSGSMLDLAAGTIRYECSMRYRPWPATVSIAGVGYQAPALLSHERPVVVDRYRAGVVT